MYFTIGFILVFVSVIGGYVGIGGALHVLWQPFEFLIIGGAGIGQFIIGNPKSVISGVIGSFGKIFKGSKFDKVSYLDLFSVLYLVFRVAKTKGDLALEGHVDAPEDSPIFNLFPGFSSNHHALNFLCDYLRLFTLGTTRAHEAESVMDQELENTHNEEHLISNAIDEMGQAFPALGIVAAVLGIIHTMGSITEPPEVLGHLIGGALVGTFFGILLSYGLVSPMASSLRKTHQADSRYLECIKVALIAHMQGYAPQVSIEFARKLLPPDIRPSFIEVEVKIQTIPSDILRPNSIEVEETTEAIPSDI
jgi:chemotaxis protein MotA